MLSCLLLLFLSSSKGLLYSFINSVDVKSILKPNEINRLTEFLKNKVFHLEETFANYKFLYVRALDGWTNTPLEGTNRGLKYCERAVRPCMSIVESTKTMNSQDTTRQKRKTRRISDAVLKTRLNSHSTTSTHISQPAEGELQKQLGLAECYVSWRSSPLHGTFSFMCKERATKSFLTSNVSEQLPCQPIF